MKKFCFALIFIYSLILSNILVAQNNDISGNKRFLKTPTKLIDKKTNKVKILYNDGKNIYPQDHKEAALSFLKLKKDIFNLDSNLENLKFSKSISSNKLNHTIFKQFYKDIPVWDGIIDVVFDKENRIKFVKNNTYPNINTPIQPNISKENAETIALKEFNEIIHEVTNAELLIFPDEKDETFLAWLLQVKNKENRTNYYVIINALTGKIFKIKDLSCSLQSTAAKVFAPDPVSYFYHIGQPSNASQLHDNSNAELPEWARISYVERNINNLSDPEQVPNWDTGATTYKWTIEGSYCKPYLYGDIPFIIEIENSPWAPDLTLDEYHCNSRDDIYFEVVNVYYHINKVREYFNNHPSFVGLQWADPTDYNFPHPYTYVEVNAPNNEEGPVYRNTGNYAGYISLPKNLYPYYVDSAEDQDVIMHEFGHAIHDARLFRNYPYGFNGVNTDDYNRIEEGFADYFSLTYRKNILGISERSNDCSLWATENHPLRSVIRDNDIYEYWYFTEAHEGGRYWAGTLMDIENIVGYKNTIEIFLEAIEYYNLNWETDVHEVAQGMVDYTMANFTNGEDILIKNIFINKGFLPENVSIEDAFSIDGSHNPDNPDILNPYQIAGYNATFYDEPPLNGMSGVTWSLYALTNNGPYLLLEEYTPGYIQSNGTYIYEYNFQTPSLIGRGQVWTRKPGNTDYVMGTLVAQGTDNNGISHSNVINVLIYHKVVGHDTPLQPICGWDHEVLVEDTVTVDVNTILTINNGTIVKFAPNAALLVQGQLFANQVTFEAAYEDDWAGLIFNGDYSSPSRILNCVVKDCIDGFTITNASPLIKTTEIKNIFKRGFNIIGIDAEPVVRQCYIHNTGTFPLQMLNEADPVFVDNRFYGGSKTGARIWGADGTFSRNEFRSNDESGVFVFSSSAQPQFYSFADSGGNMFDMSHIATQAIFIGGGNPMFGDYPNINGNNIFKNRGSRYYIYNDTPGDIDAQLSWWANGTPPNAFYNSDGGSVVFLPKLSSEPPAGPLLLKAAASPSPFNAGFEKYRQKDYAGAMQDLKESLQRDKTSIKADQAVFRLGKAARKIGKLGELETFLGDLKKEKDPQIQYHSRNWLCYLYASRNDMKKAERLLDEVPKGSSYERTLLLDICSYYASLKDMKNANRIADMLRERHNNDVLAMELEAALEGWVDFKQVKGQTRARRSASKSIPVPDVTVEMEMETAAPADTVAFKAGIYPNPFNSSTTINFNVEQSGPVQIAIYDLLGRRVQTLVDDRRATGSYRAVWNGCDNTGRSVASGIYFVHMQVGGKEQSIKISYVK